MLDAGDRGDAALHRWSVDEREYLRHTARRGRRHAYEHLDPRQTALVVIDMVPFFVRDSPYCRGIVPGINTIAAALRNSGGVVAWVVPGHKEPSPKDREFLGGDIAEKYARSGGDGSPRERVWSQLNLADDDLAVEKTAHSAFLPGSSALPDLLQEREVDTVLMTGTVTNVCVEASVRDASTLGYRVILVADACAATRDEDHNATLHVVYRTYGDVRPTGDVVSLIQAGRRPRRRA